MDDLRRSPGISAAAVAWPVDLVGPSWAPFANFQDKPFPAGQEPAVQMASVSTSYFETMRIPLRRGRLFGPQDRGGAPVVAIVNEEEVRRFLPEGDPLGRRMSLVGIPELRDLEIVGVVGNTLRAGLAGRLVTEVYCAYAQFPTPGPTVVARASAGDALLLVRTVEDRIAAINPEVATYGAKRLDDAMASTVGDSRILSLLVAMFAALALVLTGAELARAAATSCPQS
ncbi:MAG: ABC transporter permease [Acidobacteria bacterium]|nr:ABC transporter permease [Acidobacteriota bacterium]